MPLRKHLNILLPALGVWFGFWVLGLPSAYYQEYSDVTMAVAMILLSVATSLAAVALLRGGRPDTRMARAFWLSFYYTVPFAALDALYCGWYLGHGAGFLLTYWYLSIFYVTPWLTFLPTAALLNGRRQAADKPA
jgi:predicted lysophospholipase L1 biosynthesis ABC-type transport system permease subunit